MTAKNRALQPVGFRRAGPRFGSYTHDPPNHD